MSGLRATAALFAIALVARLGAMYLTDPVAKLPGAGYEHPVIARSIVNGTGFSFPFFSPSDRLSLTSQQAPLVPYALAGNYVLFGGENPTAFAGMLTLQAIFASLGVVALARAGEIITGRWPIGLVAGLMAALYPPMVIAPSHVQAVSWNIAGLSIALYGTLLLRGARPWVGAAVFAVGSSLSWYADPIAGAATIAALAGAFLLSATHRPAAILAVCLTGATLVPWTIRNYQVHGTVMAVKDSFWYVFWQGNTRASGGTDKLPLDDPQMGAWNPLAAHDDAQQVRNDARSVDVSLPREFVAQVASMPREIDRMEAFRGLILAELAADPMQYVRKVFRRLGIWVWFDDTNPRSYVPAYRAGYLALAGLALVGFWHERRRHAAWLPLLTAGGALTLVHALIITSARFRLLFESLLIPLSACAVVWLIERAFARQRWSPGQSDGPSSAVGPRAAA